MNREKKQEVRPPAEISGAVREAPFKPFNAGTVVLGQHCPGVEWFELAVGSAVSVSAGVRVHLISHPENRVLELSAFCTALEIF